MDSQYDPIVLASKNTFNQYGEEIEDIISKRPPFLVRWGIVIFSVLLCGLGMICWFIQYPDILVAKARLNSINAPKQVLNRSEGKLTKIAVQENEKVIAGHILGHMESLADPAAVMAVHDQLDTILDLVHQNRSDEIISFFSDPVAQSQNIDQLSYNLKLGELQSNYQTFVQAFNSYKDYLQRGFYVRKRKMLVIDMSNYQKQFKVLIHQKELLMQDLSLSKETFNANEHLANQKVISALDLRNEKSKFLAKQLSLPQINAAILANESQQNEKKKEVAELENNIKAQKSIFIQALQTMKSQIQAWEYKYVLTAPIAGTVNFASFIQENQELRLGQTLFFIQPDSASYFVELLIPQYNFGKVKPGQNVLLKFQAYPHEQYGSVLGKIEFISNNPSDSGYLAKVILQDGLVTNHNKTLKYQNGMSAQADIITENMRLLERFYLNLSKQFKR